MISLQSRKMHLPGLSNCKKERKIENKRGKRIRGRNEREMGQKGEKIPPQKMFPVRNVHAYPVLLINSSDVKTA